MNSTAQSKVIAAMEIINENASTVLTAKVNVPVEVAAFGEKEIAPLRIFGTEIDDGLHEPVSTSRAVFKLTDE